MNKREKFFKILKFTSVFLAILNAIFFFAMKCCWSGLSSFLKYGSNHIEFLYYLPPIVSGLFFILAITSIILYLIKDKTRNIWPIIVLSLDLIETAIIIAVTIFGAIDYLYFIIPDFITYSLIAGFLYFIAYFMFIYPKKERKTKNIIKGITFGSMVVVLSITLLNLTINSFSTKPVVYAVEDTYQIVFSTSSESIGYVKINNKTYADTYAGSYENSKIHKIIVPQKDLDEAKNYEIYSQKMFYKGPFGGFKGREIKESFAFRPVNSSDGISYYSLADIHMEKNGSIKASSYLENKDFLVLAGDIISMVDSFSNANYVNKVASEITKGEIPVIYARGNHEIKGKWADKLYKFVGSKNENFYYYFTLGNSVYGWTLDIGEDHDDDWWEYYGTADFETYRDEQISFLKEEKDKGTYSSYPYHLVVCHIPLPFINSRKNHEESKKEFISILNELDIDMEISGHQHDLLIFEPGLITPNEQLKYNIEYDGKGKTYKGYLLDFNFPTFLASKRGLTQTDDAKLAYSHNQIGFNVQVDSSFTNEIVYYNNVNGEKVNVVNPFFDKNYGDTITIDLATKSFN